MILIRERSFRANYDRVVYKWFYHHLLQWDCGTQVRGLLKSFSRLKSAGGKGKVIGKKVEAKIFLTRTLRAADHIIKSRFFGEQFFLIYTNHISKQRDRNAVWEKSSAKRLKQKMVARKNFACCRPYSQANGFHHHPCCSETPFSWLDPGLFKIVQLRFKSIYAWLLLSVALILKLSDCCDTIAWAEWKLKKYEKMFCHHKRR